MPIVGRLSGEVRLSDELVFFPGQRRAEIVRRRHEAGQWTPDDAENALAFAYRSVPVLNGTLGAIAYLNTQEIQRVRIEIGNVGGVPALKLDVQAQEEYLTRCLAGVFPGAYPWGRLEVAIDSHSGNLCLLVRFDVVGGV